MENLILLEINSSFNSVEYAKQIPAKCSHLHNETIVKWHGIA